jgi:hypothetical protein
MAIIGNIPYFQTNPITSKQLSRSDMEFSAASKCWSFDNLQDSWQTHGVLEYPCSDFDSGLTIPAGVLHPANGKKVWWNFHELPFLIASENGRNSTNNTNSHNNDL